nr:MAG TPA: hypothetical protein [Caudoviricetes sp.]DAP73566.1 MAG TPA: hypothetical protein [Caudoviricetes sp.]DAQ97268.1 MAG TPA: hypothetical protein [Caudoviricetes sp.]
MLAGIPSMMVISTSLLLLCSKSILRFSFLLCTSTIYNPDFTMRRWKTKYG